MAKQEVATLLLDEIRSSLRSERGESVALRSPRTEREAHLRLLALGVVALRRG